MYYDGNQHFYLYNVTLANLLNEIYTPKVIIDDGKAFSIDNKYQSGNRYEYVANLTVGSDSVDKQSHHEVIVLNHDCPTVYDVYIWRDNFGNTYTSTSDYGKIKAYILIQGKVYKFDSGVEISGRDRYHILIEGYDGSYFANGTMKSAAHFLCENIGG